MQVQGKVQGTRGEYKGLPFWGGICHASSELCVEWVICPQMALSLNTRWRRVPRRQPVCSEQHRRHAQESRDQGGQVCYKGGPESYFDAIIIRVTERYKHQTHLIWNRKSITFPVRQNIFFSGLSNVKIYKSKANNAFCCLCKPGSPRQFQRIFYSRTHSFVNI